MFSTSQKPSSFAFGSSSFNQSTSSTQPLNSTNDTSSIITCLNETKNINTEILNEIKKVSNILISTNNINTLTGANNINTNNINNSNNTTSFTNGYNYDQIDHKDVHCNNCMKTNIRGNRYKCLFCKDYDLCQECESLNIMTYNHTTHKSEHSMIKIKNTLIFNTMINSISNAFTL